MNFATSRALQQRLTFSITTSEPTSFTQSTTARESKWLLWKEMEM